MEVGLSSSGEDVSSFLSYVKSFNQHTRDHMATNFENKMHARERVFTPLQKEQLGKIPCIDR